MKKSRIILGTVQFGKYYGINNTSGKPSRDNVFEILNNALKEGIIFYDTADSYGESAAMLGEFFKLNSSIKILAKGSLSGRSITETVKSSLAQLGVSSVYAYSLHNTADIDYINLNEVMELKQQGLIERFGVSVYTNEEIEKAAAISIIDIIQIPFNLLDNWNLRGESILIAKKAGKEIHCRSIFLQGLFFKDLNLLPEKLKPLSEDLEYIKNISIESNISLQDLAQNYVMSFKEIDKVLVGVETLDQLVSNLLSTEVNLPQSVIAKLQNIKIQNINLLNPGNWN